MSTKSIIRVALISAAVVAVGIWAYNKFPQVSKALGGGTGTLRKAA